MRDPQHVHIKRDTLTLASTEQRYYLVHEADKTNALTRLFEIELVFLQPRGDHRFDVHRCSGKCDVKQ